MKSMALWSFVLLSALPSVFGQDTRISTCAQRCIPMALQVSNCQDMECVCGANAALQGLFQCLSLNCEAEVYAPAMKQIINGCVNKNIEGAVNDDLGKQQTRSPAAFSTTFPLEMNIKLEYKASSATSSASSTESSSPAVLGLATPSTMSSPQPAVHAARFLSSSTVDAIDMDLPAVCPPEQGAAGLSGLGFGGNGQGSYGPEPNNGGPGPANPRGYGGDGMLGAGDSPVPVGPPFVPNGPGNRPGGDVAGTAVPLVLTAPAGGYNGGDNGRGAPVITVTQLLTVYTYTGENSGNSGGSSGAGSGADNGGAGTLTVTVMQAITAPASGNNGGGGAGYGGGGAPAVTVTQVITAPAGSNAADNYGESGSEGCPPAGPPAPSPAAAGPILSAAQTTMACHDSPGGWTGSLAPGNPNNSPFGDGGHDGDGYGSPMGNGAANGNGNGGLPLPTIQGPFAETVWVVSAPSSVAMVPGVWPPSPPPAPPRPAMVTVPAAGAAPPAYIPSGNAPADNPSPGKTPCDHFKENHVGMVEHMQEVSTMVTLTVSAAQPNALVAPISHMLHALAYPGDRSGPAAPLGPSPPSPLLSTSTQPAQATAALANWHNPSLYLLALSAILVVFT